jgi:hypothetical protein
MAVRRGLFDIKQGRSAKLIEIVRIVTYCLFASSDPGEGEQAGNVVVLFELKNSTRMRSESYWLSKHRSHKE